MSRKPHPILNKYRVILNKRSQYNQPMKGKQVLLTGGTGGLGMGVTPLAISQGAKVTIPYRNETEVERLKSIKTNHV
ncbi:hypothetical protein L8106_25845 [Lyngbya sp. PCC 8106]|nr:hypothetical protein L8106_25845 [Lyngbya sp. PCC 8106]